MCVCVCVCVCACAFFMHVCIHVYEGGKYLKLVSNEFFLSDTNH